MEEEKYHEEVIISQKVTKSVEDPTKERLIDNGRRRVLKTFLTLGPTRMGKSSFINALAGKPIFIRPICVVGKSSGSQQSTTIKSVPINSILMTLTRRWTTPFR